MARVLCIDDDPGATDLKRTILQRAHHDVVICSTVEQAIGLLRSITFDAVITDWRMNDEQSGREIVEAAKTNSTAPVVVVSGHVSEAFRAAGPAADLYLEKPVDPEELIKALDALLRARHLAEHRPESNTP